MSYIFSQTQTAYIKNRQIMQNIIHLQNIMDLAKKKVGKDIWLPYDPLIINL